MVGVVRVSYGVREISGATVVGPGKLSSPDLLVREGHGQQGIPPAGHGPGRGQFRPPPAATTSTPGVPVREKTTDLNEESDDHLNGKNSK